MGKLCISTSAHLDPPSIWTSSHSPGTARVGPHPPVPWLTEGTDWANTVVAPLHLHHYRHLTRSKHDESKQKTGITRWLICQRSKIQLNSDVNKLWCYKRPPKTTPTIQQITTWAWLQVFVMLALENKSQTAGRITIPGTASNSCPKNLCHLPIQTIQNPNTHHPLSQQNPVGNVSGTSAGKPRCLRFNPRKAHRVWLRDRRETSLRFRL